MVCPQYTKPTKGRGVTGHARTCGEDTCENDEYLGPDGGCKKCPAYERPLAGGRACGPESCTVLQ